MLLEIHCSIVNGKCQDPLISLVNISHCLANIFTIHVLMFHYERKI
jgi:hypothetical protein